MSRHQAVGSSGAPAAGVTGGRGGGRGGGGHPAASVTTAGAAKRESILELQKLLDASVRVKCVGGRELEGTLRGYDDLVNLVLDDCDEYVRDPATQKATDQRRRLGQVVVRGTQVSLVSPVDGMEEIANPFVAQDED